MFLTLIQREFNSNRDPALELDFIRTRFASDPDFLVWKGLLESTRVGGQQSFYTCA